MQDVQNREEITLSKRFENLHSGQFPAFSAQWWEVNQATVNGLLVVAIALMIAVIIIGHPDSPVVPAHITAASDTAPVHSSEPADNGFIQILSSFGLVIILLTGFGVVSGFQSKSLISSVLNLLIGAVKVVAQVIVTIAPPLARLVSKVLAYLALRGASELNTAMQKHRAAIDPTPTAQPMPDPVSAVPVPPVSGVPKSMNPFLEELLANPGRVPPPPNPHDPPPIFFHGFSHPENPYSAPQKFKKNPYDDPPDIDIVE